MPKYGGHLFLCSSINRKLLSLLVPHLSIVATIRGVGHVRPWTLTSLSQLPLSQVTVGQVSAGQEIDISVEMCSPPDQGMFQGKWRMCNPGGNFFGGLSRQLPLAV